MDAYIRIPINKFDTNTNPFVISRLQNNFHGDELAVYTQHLNTLQKLYTELLSTSSKRLSDLETLLDFLQSVSNHLVWLNEKEEIELTRDWSDRDLNLAGVQQYYKVSCFVQWAPLFVIFAPDYSIIFPSIW